MQYVFVCEGDITLNTLVPSTSLPTCLSGWKLQPYVPPFDPSALDPMIIAQMFSGGFLLFLTPWAAAWGFSKMLKLLR